MSLYYAFLSDPRRRSITLHELTTMTRLLSVLKNDILLPQPPNIDISGPPPLLGPNIVEFLVDCLGLPADTIRACWDGFKEEVWTAPMPTLSKEEKGMFAEHGWHRGLTYLTLFPPMHQCRNDDCTHTTPLKKEESRQVVVYTVADGAVPAWSIHLYCPSCNTNFHHNYAVNGGTRTYYPTLPTYVQVGEHQFIERKLVGLWISLHLTAWVSFTNCSRSYAMALAGDTSAIEKAGWQFGTELTTDHVSNAFIIATLLDYHERKGTVLDVPHTGDKRDRFVEAMRERNREVVECGQDEIKHTCDKCTRVWKEEDGTERDVQVIVGDGLAMGHPKCGHDHCTNELSNNRDRFCSDHAGDIFKCSIVGCEEPVVPDRKACSNPDHLKMEDMYYLRTSAAFTLTDRLSKHRVAHPTDADPDADPDADAEAESICLRSVRMATSALITTGPAGSVGVDDPLLVDMSPNPSSTSPDPNDASPDPNDASADPNDVSADPSDASAPNNNSDLVETNPAATPTATPAADTTSLPPVPPTNAESTTPCEATKAEGGNRKFKAHFARLRSHNEFGISFTCGIWAQRATMYTDEAVSNALLCVQKSFSVPGARKPDIFVYDTNCNAKQQVEAHKNTHWRWFQDVGLPVDVFHFLHKHGVGHTFCQEWCNPAKFPELMNEDRTKWWFNTSIAEQNNVWLGGYHSMCREMGAVKYNFFLNEMVRLHNKETLAKLEAAGANPRYWSV
ncbi:hypothetical protein HMN09_00790100 [Mycena chlorophos]|uniref:CxC5 like cysteine cluster associated with KDZ domain-containing protein n=1 Tax=Mycena chlorophos TaxID=658473 RepID=A0A8H6WAK9_MYCCL|nr:hypothetical protein HMN09_00790100 [Mycena chlorophos]